MLLWGMSSRRNIAIPKDKNLCEISLGYILRK